MRCDYCGDLDWTVKKYGAVIHKEACPHREDWRSQTYPYESIGTQGRVRWAPGFGISVDREDSILSGDFIERVIAACLGELASTGRANVPRDAVEDVVTTTIAYCLALRGLKAEQHAAQAAAEHPQAGDQ